MQLRIGRLMQLLGLLLIASSLVGCVTGRRRGGGDDDSSSQDDDDAVGSDDDDGGGDSDGDGLSDSFEGQIGTDPNDVDSDGDGAADGVEYLSYFFPDDASDWPYLGDYPRQPIPRSLSSGGSGLGSVPANFTSSDQHGQDISLHRFYGNVVVIELAAEW